MSNATRTHEAESSTENANPASPSEADTNNRETGIDVIGKESAQETGTRFDTDPSAERCRLEFGRDPEPSGPARKGKSSPIEAPVCEFCGGYITEQDQQCMARDSGRCVTYA